MCFISLVKSITGDIAIGGIADVDIITVTYGFIIAASIKTITIGSRGIHQILVLKEGWGTLIHECSPCAVTANNVDVYAIVDNAEKVAGRHSFGGTYIDAAAVAC